MVTFADGTDEEISAMLDAHYAGKINIEDYWSVGDTRKIQLNAMSAGTGASESHAKQLMTMVIIGFNHDDLVTQTGERTKAAVTIQCREVLGSYVYIDNGEKGYYWGSQQDTTIELNYAGNPRRTWLNNTFIKSVPLTLQPLIKTVTKKNLKNHSSDLSSATKKNNTKDKAFLLSYPEVFGTQINSDYLNGEEVSNYEGTQYKYYETSSNRIKFYNKDGEKDNYEANWWLRSPSTSTYDNIVSRKEYEWFVTNYSGIAEINTNYSTNNFCPAFCL